MSTPQTGILGPVPLASRYLFLRALPGADPRPALRELLAHCDGESVVVGIGASLVASLGTEIPGLKLFPAYAVGGIDIPSTPTALWVWLRGEDRGALLHKTRALVRALAPAFAVNQTVDGFRHDVGRDLTGYEDGTENPKDDDAVAAAIVSDAGPGLAGGSFVAVQLWVHDLDRFDTMSGEARDHMIGRRSSDNEEIEDAPESAHVKRTAQESFTPEAFVLRRSMPWTNDTSAGLVFVAFGKSLAASEAQLQRMLGLEDGITDALFTFTRPITGNYFWCPPMSNGHMDLSALGIAAKN